MNAENRGGIFFLNRKDVSLKTRAETEGKHKNDQEVATMDEVVDLKT